MKSTLTLLLLLGGIPFISNLQQPQQKAINEQLIDDYQTQRYSEAVTLLKTNYPEPVTDIKILSSMAYASQMAGMLPDAEKYYQRIYDLDSSNYHVLFNLGNLNVRKGNDQKAKGYFEKFLQKDSTNFTVYKDLAEIGLNDGDTKVTTKYLEKANKLQPTDADVASELSGFYIEAKRFSDAETILDVAIDADKENIYLLQGFVKLKYTENKFKDVIEYGEKLFQLGDNATFVRNKVGEAYYYTGKFDCGIETLMAIQPAMQTEVSYYYIAECYKGLKNQTKAIEYFNKAIEAGLSPNIDSYYSEIGDSYTKLDKNNKALAAYQKSLQFDEKPMTYYLMADIYDTNLKNKASAIKYYKRFLASSHSAKQSKYATYAKSRIEALSR
jgi:tetratricopeptide (TPR) repeat protein